ncbi:hypothetical protein [Paraburkholderia lycopersici]|uniref:Uncharacterized protein n=1 Tax=Paraburkholderia lycopersici TaxID=416944 RepID=A0A1G6HD52_9BURK|nr:hypothetical protein [Paraburkholderia lycopersici]SDB92247.1 hypothetical protein SAMN05421548_102201 [Paraburkholderia lycopersici]
MQQAVPNPAVCGVRRGTLAEVGANLIGIRFARMPVFSAPRAK